MVLHIIVFFCETQRTTYFLALNVLYNILETLYMSYYAIGFSIYIFTLISYLPFILSLLRMLKRDTETRRLIFYRSNVQLWFMIAAIDLWNLLDIVPDIIELCEISHFMPDISKIASQFRPELLESRSLIGFCLYRLQLHNLVNTVWYHLIYGYMVFMSRRLW